MSQSLEEEIDKFYNTPDDIKSQCKLQEMIINLTAKVKKEQDSQQVWILQQTQEKNGSSNAQ